MGRVAAAAGGGGETGVVLNVSADPRTGGESAVVGRATKVFVTGGAARTAALTCAGVGVDVVVVVGVGTAAGTRGAAGGGT